MARTMPSPLKIKRKINQNLSPTTATSKDTSSPNAGPKEVVRKVNAHPGTTIAKTTIAITTTTITTSIRITIMPTQPTRTQKHGLPSKKHRLQRRKSTKLITPTFSRWFTARGTRSNYQKSRSSSMTPWHLGVCPPSLINLPIIAPYCCC